MIYQLRVFTDYPGRVNAHIERFRDFTCRYLEKHGMKVIGCFTPVAEDQQGVKRDQVVFISAHESLQALQRAQESFANDPEVKAFVAASEKEEPIIKERMNWYLEATDFSPLR